MQTAVNNRKLRILYHHRTLGDGAEGIHIREMVSAFRKLGHEVKIIGPIGEAPPGYSPGLQKLERIKKLIPPLVYEWMEVAYSAYAFCKATWEIWRFKPNFIYERYITFNIGVTLAGKVNRVPVLLEVNAPLALERQQQKDEKLVLRRIASAMERWVCAHATRTIVVSTPLKDYLQSIGVPADQCVVMPNGVDPERFSPREIDKALRTKLKIPEDSFVIGFTGVLRPWHGLDLLLEAFGSLLKKETNAFLLVVGDGPYRATVEKIARDSGIQHAVCVTGRISHDAVPAYVSLFDVAVSPRATFYASPMKVIEYMALGKPVVVPGTQNFLDIVNERVNGITFQDGDAQALGEALAALCESPDFCRELGVNARYKVENRLNWRWNAEKSCELALAEGEK